jgi:hypothetical protein
MMVFRQGLLVSDWKSACAIDLVGWDGTYVNTAEAA